MKAWFLLTVSISKGITKEASKESQIDWHSKLPIILLCTTTTMMMIIANLIQP